MSHVPHELADDFPEMVEQISHLKTENAHFARLANEYHELNRQVHRIETNVEAVDDFTAQTLRKQRMALKDEISKMLASA